MSTSTEPEKARTILLDLTGKVKYEAAGMIAGGHARVYPAVLTDSEGTATTVRLLLPRHCGSSAVTHTSPGCSQGR